LLLQALLIDAKNKLINLKAGTELIKVSSVDANGYQKAKYGFLKSS
jgi:hypothetical protein